MPLYVVNIESTWECEAVVFAESKRAAETIARGLDESDFGYVDHYRTEDAYTEVESLGDLPPDWQGDDQPFGDTEDTIEEILTPVLSGKDLEHAELVGVYRTMERESTPMFDRSAFDQKERNDG